MRAHIIGGSIFTEKLIKDLDEYFPNGKSLVGYGLTEADTVTFSCPDEGTVGTSSGYPYYNTNIKIVDDNGAALGPNDVGEIYYKTAVPFTGYFGEPEKYEESFDAFWFVKSGDAGYFDEFGRIYVVDRMKHMIKSIESHNVTPIEHH